jgi:hypothetical protein
MWLRQTTILRIGDMTEPFIRKALGRLAESLDSEKLATQALRPEAPTSYRLPGAPPTGSHVLTNPGGVFVRVPDRADSQGQWGMWEEVRDDDETPIQVPWSLLLEYGPLILLPETEKDRASAVLYGPVGARWGDPDSPCPYRDCGLGLNHTGPHKDPQGTPLGVTEADPGGRVHTSSITPGVNSQVICTCGTPANHQPQCPRFPRTSG